MKESAREMTIKIHNCRLKKLGSFWERNERFNNMFGGKRKEMEVHGDKKNDEMDDYG